MQQLGCRWGKINEKKLTEKKNFCGQAILLVVIIESMSYLRGVRYSIQNINLQCLVHNR